jgi:hypothetical protein
VYNYIYIIKTKSELWVCQVTILLLTSHS